MTPYPANALAALFVAPGDGTDILAAMKAAAQGGVRIGKRIGTDLPKPKPDTGLPLPLRPCPFVAVGLAQGSPETLSQILRALVDTVAIDLNRSALLVGTEYIVKPGEGDVLVTMLVRRRISYTPAAFRDRWLGEHARFGLGIPVSGYRQLHADPRPLPGLPPTDCFDGAGMVLFRDAAHVASARAAP